MTTTEPRHRVDQPRRRPARVLAWIALVVGIVVLVTSAGAYAAYRHLNGNITRADVFHGVAGDRGAAAEARRGTNFLLVGSDTRQGKGDGGQYQGQGSDYVTGGRSDTTILLHVSAHGEKATLMSIPRDLYVTVPACEHSDGKLGRPFKAKFNAAFAVGGPSCLIKTVQSLTGITIDHYAEIDFSGFKTMVSALGGVPVCLTDPMHDKESGLDLSAGRHVITGDMALAFVRARYNVGPSPGSDLARVKRQQIFLAAMLRKATSTGLLLNPVRLYQFLDDATSAMTFDPGLGLSELRTLASQLRGLNPAKVTFLTMPVTTEGADVPIPPYAHQSVALMDVPTAHAVFDALRADRPLGSEPEPGATPTPTATLPVAPSDVSVRVLNGSSTSGLAGRTAQALRDEGFDVSSVGDAPAHVAVTQIRYPSSQADAARTLAAVLPDAQLVRDPTLTGVLLVLGPDAPTVQPLPGAGPSATASPTPSGTATPVPVPTLNAATESCAA